MCAAQTIQTQQSARYSQKWPTGKERTTEKEESLKKKKTVCRRRQSRHSKDDDNGINIFDYEFLCSFKISQFSLIPSLSRMRLTICKWKSQNCSRHGGTHWGLQNAFTQNEKKRQGLRLSRHDCRRNNNSSGSKKNNNSNSSDWMAPNPPSPSRPTDQPTHSVLCINYKFNSY